MTSTILLTFDVEDWFQVENFKQCIPFSAWPSCELRVEKNVHKILDLLDSVKLNNSTNSINPRNVSRESASRKGFNSTIPINSLNTQHSTLNTRDEVSQSSVLCSCSAALQHCSTAAPKTQNLELITQNSPRGTFFILGWLAERLPHLVREIQSRGHEIASHGFDHGLCYELSAQCLRADLVRSKELLEDLAGSPVYGYRAPSFSISEEILGVIKETGYLYDSSFNSFGLNKRYGQIELNGNGRKGIAHKISEAFYEIPISNVKIGGRTLPWGGGGYFRLFPLSLFHYGVQSILKKQGAYLFYMHPWEVDPGQPRVAEAPTSFKFRHYVNLDKTHSKLSRFLESFKGCHFSTCFQYIEEISKT